MNRREIELKLQRLGGWKYLAARKALVREFQTAGFTAAARKISRIAALAEKMDHHPDVHLTRYRRLRVVLTTHSAGAVTKKDFALAAKIEKLFIVLVLSIGVLFAPCAEAAWVTENKKQVTPLQGFQDSANGAVKAVLPWNWFSAGEEKPMGYEAARKKMKTYYRG